jgi:hypothetical protein
MTYFDSTHMDYRPAPLAFDALMAHLDPERAELQRRPVLEVEVNGRLRRVQQMLLAATVASGAILAAAAIVMLRML